MLRNNLLLVLFAAFAGASFIGCSDDDDTVPLVNEDELTWPEVEYTAEDSPSVMSIPARDDWGTMTPPLTVTGEDNGKEGIVYSVTLSHYWALKTQQPDGNYLYDWNAETDETTDEQNGIRQLSTAWGAMLTYRFNQREEIMAGAYRLAKAYASRLKREEGPNGMIAHYNGAMATTAFMLYLLIELEEAMGTGEFSETITELGRYMELMVDEDGCMWTQYPYSGGCAEQYGIEREDGTTSGPNVFAVGQGLVAFERLFLHTGDEKWLDPLEESATFYMNYFPDLESTPFLAYWSAWAVGPMVGLVLERPNPELEAYIFDLADTRTLDQYIVDAPGDYIGGFKKIAGRPPTWSASSMAETIVDAYRLAEARQDEERMKVYRQSGILAARYLMRLQYRADNVDGQGLAAPEKAIGAYHFSTRADASSIPMHYVRCDYMYHFVATLLKTVAYLDLPETYPGVGLKQAPSDNVE